MPYLPQAPKFNGSKNVSAGSGFTLIEISVAMFGFVLLVVGLIALVSGVIRGASQQSGLLADSDQARKLAFSTASELRNAVTSATGSYSLEQAGAQQIIFYSNIDKDPSPERIRYFVQNGALHKGIVDPGGNPPAYDLGAERIVAVQNNLANGSDPVFYYYGGNFDGTADSFLSQPVSVTAVKFVKVSLRIYNKGGVKNASTYTVTSSATIRNLKSNLGD